MTPTDVRRRGVAALLVGLLVTSTGCSSDDGTPRTDPPTTAGASTEALSTSQAPEPTPEETPEQTPEETPTASPKPKGYPNRVTCLPVDDDMAGAIAAGSPETLTPVPGSSVAYQPADLEGTYLVVMVFTGPGRLEGAMGVWAVQRSIEPGDHGAISSVDRIARFVTTWPVAQRVVEDDIRVSEVRACTLT